MTEITVSVEDEDVAALRKCLRHVKDDCGPDGYSWKSPELRTMVSRAEDLTDRIARQLFGPAPRTPGR